MYFIHLAAMKRKVEGANISAEVDPKSECPTCKHETCIRNTEDDARAFANYLYTNATAEYMDALTAQLLKRYYNTWGKIPAKFKL